MSPAARSKNPGHSTGPKTTSGKKRSSKNALRHGLAIPIGLHTEYDAAITRLTRLIAGHGASEMRLRFAQQIAETQIDVLRIREARNRKLAQAAALHTGSLVPDPRFDRYERRARARRKAAILAFDMNIDPEPRERASQE